MGAGWGVSRSNHFLYSGAQHSVEPVDMGSLLKGSEFVVRL